MANINEILARAAALRDETALNSISPERAGGIMYDTLIVLNELWLQQGAALVISKIYASVDAMEADTAPVSDISGKPLRPGQIVVIASEDEDNGSVYRYNGTDSPSWSLVGNIGNLEPVDSLDSDSTQLPLAAHQGKVLDEKISQLGQDYSATTGSIFKLTEIEYTTGGYIKNNGAVVDVDDVRSSASWKYAVVACSQGDKFVLNGTGASEARLYSFIDSDGNKLLTSAEGATANNMIIVAPALTATLVLNSSALNKVSYKGLSLQQFYSDSGKIGNFSSGLFGEALSVIGDSISSINEVGYKYGSYSTFYPNAGVANHDMMYWGLLMKLTGMRMEVNASEGGSGACKYTDKHSFYERVSILGEPDTIVVALGMNDSLKSTAIGEIDYDASISDLSENYFGSAYLKGIKSLLATYTDAKIICLILEMGDAYASTIAEIAAHYSLKCIDARGYTFGEDGQGHDITPHPGILGMKEICASMLNTGRLVNLEEDENGDYIVKAGSATLGNVASADNMQTTIENLGKDTGIVDIPITKGGYIQTNGTTVDVTSIETNITYGYAVVNCIEGDVFTITSKAGSAPRCWCFIDSEGNVLQVAYLDMLCEDTMLIAPANTSKLVCNFLLTWENGYSLHRNALGRKFQKDFYSLLNSQPRKLEDNYVIKAYIGTDNKWGYVNNAGTTTYLIPVKEGDGIVVGAPATANSTYFALLRSMPIYIVAGGTAPLSQKDGYDTAWSVYVGSRYIKVPSDAKYLAVTSTINGTSRLPSSVVINGYDVISGKRIDNKFFGGSYGEINGLLEKNASKLIITVIDDDTQNVASIEALKDLCDANEIKCTMATLADKWENTPALLALLKEMESEGHHIAYHAYSQDSAPGGLVPWTDFDEREEFYTANFVKGLRMVHEQGFLNSDFWVTPSGQATLRQQALAKKFGMKALIMAHLGINLNTANNIILASHADTSHELDYRDCSRWNLVRVNFPFNDTTIPGWTIDKLNSITARGVEHGAWIILISHSYQWIAHPEDFPDYESRFADYVTYAQSLGYEFMTLGEAWEYKKSIYDLFDLR